MNKTIKRIIAMSLVVGAFSMIEPTKYLNLTTIKAYASSDNIYLRSISVSDGDSFSLINGKTTYKVDVSKSTEETTIRVKTDDDNDKVTIAGDSSPEEYASKSFRKVVDLDEGKNEFEIKVEDEDGENERTYILDIYRGGSSSTSTKYDDIFLDNIILSDGEIDFAKDKSLYDINVATNVNKINIKSDPEDKGYTVKIDGVTVDEDDKYRSSVNLSMGKNVIQIVIENEDYGEERIYTLNIYRGGSQSTTLATIDNTQDSIYLDDLLLDDGTVKFTPSFNQKVSSYAADVAESYDNMIIKSPPEDDDYVVRVNGDKVDSNNRKRVNLNKGKNIIKIQVSNEDDYDSDNEDSDNEESDTDYEERVYTLTVYRGTSDGSSTTATNSVAGTTNQNTNSTELKVSQWVNVDGRWQYNDSLGNPLKNTWHYDDKYGKTYYLQADGHMATGWLYNNGSWYSLDASGAMQTGWKQIGPVWYYLYASGNMATNTTIDGYKIGADGAWMR